MRKVLIATASLALLSVFLASPGQARGQCDKDCKHTSVALNPDAHTSLTLLFGIGNEDGWNGIDADVTQYSLGLVHPTTSTLSLLAKYEHDETDWDSGFNWRSTDRDLFSVGVRLYIK